MNAFWTIAKEIVRNLTAQIYIYIYIYIHIYIYLQDNKKTNFIETLNYGGLL